MFEVRGFPYEIKPHVRDQAAPRRAAQPGGMLRLRLCIRFSEDCKEVQAKFRGWHLPPYKMTIEGMITENILASLPNSARAWFYRTAAGAEVDLVLELAPKTVWAIEVKRSISNPAPSKGFYLASADVKASRQIVVYPGKEAFHLDAKTEVAPLCQLVKDLARLSKT